MKHIHPKPSDRQKNYYQQTATSYDGEHQADDVYHRRNAEFFCVIAREVSALSVLDVGAGTGRGIRFIKGGLPGIRIVGIEPVAALRAAGHAAGIPTNELVDGDVMHIHYPDNSFDFVCEFAVLHHVPRPEAALREMLRVARKGVFLSDSNRFAQGRFGWVKYLLWRLRLWNAITWIRTGGRGYFESEGDGIFYSFSVFDLLPHIKRNCSHIYIFNPHGMGINPLWSAPQVGVLALKAIAEKGD